MTLTSCQGNRYVIMISNLVYWCMVATHIKKIKYSMLCVTGVYRRNVTNTILVILHLNVSHLSFCSSCWMKEKGRELSVFWCACFEVCVWELLQHFLVLRLLLVQAMKWPVEHLSMYIISSLSAFLFGVQRRWYFYNLVIAVCSLPSSNS